MNHGKSCFEKIMLFEMRILHYKNYLSPIRFYEAVGTLTGDDWCIVATQKMVLVDSIPLPGMVFHYSDPTLSYIVFEAEMGRWLIHIRKIFRAHPITNMLFAH